MFGTRKSSHQYDELASFHLLVALMYRQATPARVLELVQKGADPNTKHLGISCIGSLITGEWTQDRAQEWKFTDERTRNKFLSELARYGANLDLKQGKEQLSVMQWLMRENPLRLNLIMHLIRLGANSNPYDSDYDKTLLHMLVSKKNNNHEYLKAIEELVKERRASLSYTDRDGFTPLQRVMEETPIRAEIAMYLVRLGADPNTRIVNSLVRKLDKENKDGKYDDYIKELIEVHHATDDRKDPLADMLDEFIKENHIQEDVLAQKKLRGVRKELIEKIKKLPPKFAKKGLLAARNDSTFLGEIIQGGWRREFTALIQVTLDETCPEGNKELKQKMGSFFDGKTSVFDWVDALKLIEDGVNPSLHIERQYSKSSKLFAGKANITLCDIFSIAWVRGQRPNIDVIKKLTSVGVRFHHEKSEEWSPMGMVLHDRRYDFAVLFLHNGASDTFFHRTDALQKEKISILDKVVEDISAGVIHDPSSLLSDIFYFEVSVSKENREKLAIILLDWLHNLKADSLFWYHPVSNFKRDIFNAIKKMPDDQSLKYLRGIYWGLTELSELFRYRRWRVEDWDLYNDVKKEYKKRTASKIDVLSISDQALKTKAKLALEEDSDEERPQAPADEEQQLASPRINQ